MIMKTITTFSLLFFIASFIGCDSAVEPAAQQLAGKGSTFAYAQDEFDADGNQIDATSNLYTIDSTNMMLDARTDVMRATASDDTLLFARDGASLLVYRPELELFENISVPKRWKQIQKSNDTNVVEIGTYTGKTTLNGADADITIRDREQYLGSSQLTINGKTFEVISKSFSVDVEVSIPQFGVTATTTVTEIDGYAPELGFLVSIKQIRSTDSEFSPITPGRTELQLSSYTIK